jgi:hypothetical protein
MAVAVGTFQIGTGAIGTEYSVTGLAARPAFVRLRWSGANAAPDAGPTRDSIIAGYGFIMENGKRGCIGYFIQNNADPYTARSGLWNTAAVVRGVPVGTTGKADFSSMNEDGFSLIIDEVFSQEITVFYEAITGAEFNTIEGTEPGATGVVEYTGAGFRPTFVQALITGKTTFDTPSSDIHYGIGMGTGPDAANQGVLTHYEQSGIGSANSLAVCRDTNIMEISDGTNVLCSAKLTGFTEDGLEVNWTARDSTRKFILIVATGRWYVGNSDTRTDTNPFSSTGMTWTPEGVEVLSAACPGPGTGPNPQQSIGFGTGPANRVLCYTRGVVDGGPTASIAVYSHQSDAIYANVDNASSPANLGLMDINSAFAADTIEWVMDDADPAAEFFIFNAFGPPILAFRQRLVRYQHNTYSSRAAGRTIVRDVLGRTISGWELRPDNWLFSGGPGFVTPKKFASLLVNPSTFYMETVQPLEGGAKIETNREALFVSLMRRLAG